MAASSATNVLSPPSHAVTEAFRRAFPDSSALIEIKPTEWPPLVQPSVPGYQLHEELGRGGMGVVYAATQTSLGRKVALKLLLAGQYASRDDRSRFRREVEAVARLSHANIVQVYDVGEHEGIVYAAYEYIEGGTLSAWLRTNTITNPQAAEFVAALAHGVQHAHDAGILHRDLKPGNILIAECGMWNADLQRSDSAFRNPHSAILAKISDFGLAKRLNSDSKLTITGTACGTPQYMAPEQIHGEEPVGPAADVYGLGAMLYELLTGRPPFEGHTSADVLRAVLRDEPPQPRSLRATVPKDLATIALKCLEKEPAKRYASASALAADLESWLDGRTIVARPVGRVERGMRWCKRNTAAAALIAALAVATAAATTLAVVLAQTASSEHREREAAEAARDDARTLGGVAQAAQAREAVERARAEENFLAARAAMHRVIFRLMNEARIREFESTDLPRTLLNEYRPFIAGLVEKNPESAELLADDSEALVSLSLLSMASGDYAGADQYIAVAVQRADRAAALKPDWLPYQYCQATAANALADLDRRRGRLDEALAGYERADKLLAAQDALGSRLASYRREAFVARLGLADVAMKKLDYATAEKRGRDNITVIDSLIATHGESIEYLQHKAWALNNLAVCLQKQKKHDETAELFRASAVLREKALETPGAPSRHQLRAALALSVFNLGQELTRRGKHREAETEYARAAGLYAESMRDAPHLQSFRIDRAKTLAQQATAIGRQGRAAEALPIFTEAEEILKPLYTKNPKLESLRDGMRLVSRGRAISYEQVEQYEDAAAAWAACIPLAAQPEMVWRYRAWQSGNLARAGKTAEAATIADEVEAATSMNDIVFELAMTWGAIANSAAKVNDDAQVASAVARSKKLIAKLDAAGGLKGSTHEKVYRQHADFKLVK